MRKGVYSMYATKEKNKSFYEPTYMFPEHKNAEVYVHLTNRISSDITRNMKKCIDGMTITVLDATVKGRRKF